MTLKILVSGAFSSTLKVLALENEKGTGVKIISELGASTGGASSSIPKQMVRDEPADVLILVGDDLQMLVDSGHAVAGSRVDNAGALIGAAIRSGLPKPDIGTEAGLKAALLAARSIGYSESASGAYVKNQLFKRFGIEDQVGDRATMVSGKAVGEVVATGEFDFGFQQMAELMPVEGISILGLLPKQLQVVTTIAAAISANSKRRDEAAAFIAFLAAPAREAILKKNGLEPTGYQMASMTRDPHRFTVRPSTLPPLPQIGSRPQSEGFYRTILGDYELTVILDGTDLFSLEKLLTDDDPDEVHRTLEQSGLTASVETSINTYLINTGDHLILVDAGAGRFLGDHCGRQLINLATAGYAPEQIDTILLTHIHPDHTGGLAVDGRMTFPNATIHVSQADLDYWFDAAQQAEADAEHKKMIEESQIGLRPYIVAGRIQPFASGDALSSDIKTIPAPGHTVGHTLFRIESKGEVIVLFGDIVHSGDVQMPYPGVAIKLDSDVVAAAATRRQVLAKFARDRTLIGGSHLSFPGLGHVRREGKGYVWLPLPYNSHPTTAES